MDAYMNKEQNNPEDQQAAKAAMEHANQQERVHTAKKQIYLSSNSLSYLSSYDSSERLLDESSDSGTRQKLTKPVSSSNKSSTFQVKLRSNNEETPLKQPHHGSFTWKQEILERINFLHYKCGFFDTEHLFTLPFNWLNCLEVPDVNVDILENFYNAFRTPKYFFVEKYSESWDPKIHSPRNYPQSFYVSALIYKCGTTNHYPLAMY